jgi:transcriptional regulator with XRE-family HTH domain
MSTLEGLRYWRLARKLSQQALAACSGISQGTISLIERGTQRGVTLATVNKLAHALQIAPHELVRTAPREALDLTRHEREAIAHAVVTGVPAPQHVPQQIVRDLAGLVTQKLRAYHAPGAAVNRGRRWRVERRWITIRAQYGEDLVRDLLHRIDTELLRYG